MENNSTPDSTNELQQSPGGSDNSQNLASLNNLMAETIGMSMHNAVTTQQNAQMLNSATTTSTCPPTLEAISADNSDNPEKSTKQ